MNEETPHVVPVGWYNHERELAVSLKKSNTALLADLERCRKLSEEHFDSWQEDKKKRIALTAEKDALIKVADEARNYISNTGPGYIRTYRNRHLIDALNAISGTQHD